MVAIDGGGSSNNSGRSSRIEGSPEQKQENPASATKLHRTISAARGANGPQGGGTFVVSTGNEGSGTTSTTRLLAHAGPGTVGIPNNWNVAQLASPRTGAQGSLDPLEARTFNMAMIDLWRTSTRGPVANRTKLAQAGQALRAIVERTNATWVVLHSSMPFGRDGKGQGNGMPVFSDLPLLVGYLGTGWSAAIVITVRDLPSAWLSDAAPKKTPGPLAAMEALLAGEDAGRVRTTGGVPVAFLRYRRLHCDVRSTQKEELRPLARLGFAAEEQERLLGSPELVPRPNGGKHATASYQKGLKKGQRMWRNISWAYPCFDALVASDICEPKNS